jgi:hypothetical protein
VPASQTLEELAGSALPPASFQGREEETFRCVGHGAQCSMSVLSWSGWQYDVNGYVHGDRCQQLQAHHLRARPKISRDAHARPARTVQEMSRGDALRHELLLVCCTKGVAAKSHMATDACVTSRCSTATIAVLTNRAAWPEVCVHDA